MTGQIARLVFMNDGSGGGPGLSIRCGVDRSRAGELLAGIWRGFSEGSDTVDLRQGRFWSRSWGRFSCFIEILAVDPQLPQDLGEQLATLAFGAMMWDGR